MVVTVMLSIIIPIEPLETTEFIRENSLLPVPVTAVFPISAAAAAASEGTLFQLESHNFTIFNYNPPFDN